MVHDFYVWFNLCFSYRRYLLTELDACFARLCILEMTILTNSKTPPKLSWGTILFWYVAKFAKSMLPDCLRLLDRLGIHIGFIHDESLNQEVSIIDIQRIWCRFRNIKDWMLQFAVFDLLPDCHTLLFTRLRYLPLLLNLFHLKDKLALSHISSVLIFIFNREFDRVCFSCRVNIAILFCLNNFRNKSWCRLNWRLSCHKWCYDSSILQYFSFGCQAEDGILLTRGTA